MSQTPHFNTLAEAKEYLRANWQKGVSCPCCDQFVKLYKRKITSSMAWALVLVHKYFVEHPNAEWLHVSNYLSDLDIPAPVKNTGDISKLVWWDILEAKQGEREDGSKRVGYYRITDLGRRFVQNQVAVAKEAFLYNQKFYGFSKETVTIKQCLNNKFDYDELMGQLPPVILPPSGQAELNL